MVPVIALTTGATILSVVLIGTIAATEKSCEPSRRDYIRLARGVVRHRVRRAHKIGNEMLIEESRAVLIDIRLLEKNVALGWTTQLEGAALARVTLYTSVGLAVNAADDAIEGVFALGDEIVDAFTGLTADLHKAFGWIYSAPNAMPA
jgi:hypothetical protein